MVLKVIDASVVRDGRRVLDAVTLSFRNGTVTAIIGPNGSGKSTLLRVLAGSVVPDSGIVLLEDLPLADIPPRELAIRRAVLSQERPMDFAFTVQELTAMGARAGARRKSAGNVDALVSRALDRVGLQGMARHRIDRMSGGERQRAHLARALVQLWSGVGDGCNGILLLDEPLSAQDLVHQLDILDLSQEHASAGGLVVIVLHDLNAAARVADRIVVLDRGQVVADGKPPDILTAKILASVFQVERVEGTGTVAAILPQLSRRLSRG
jgi:iron complex transport system ATP-binding protein